jgi:hypothetical protein
MLAELQYQIEDAGPKHIDMVVPYIEYADFQTTATYKSGMGYSKFLELLRRDAVGGARSEKMLTDYAADVCVRMAAYDSVTSSSSIKTPAEDLDGGSWPDWQEDRPEKICGSMAIAGARIPAWLPVGLSLPVLPPLNYHRDGLFALTVPLGRPIFNMGC